MLKVGKDLQGHRVRLTDPYLSATSSHLWDLGKLKALRDAASGREFQPPLPKKEKQDPATSKACLGGTGAHWPGELHLHPSGRSKALTKFCSMGLSWPWVQKSDLNT